MSRSNPRAALDAIASGVQPPRRRRAAPRKLQVPPPPILADLLLGELPDDVVKALGASTTVRRVHMSMERHRHAIERRRQSSLKDVNLVASRVKEALAGIRFQLLPQRDQRVFALVCFIRSVARWVVIPLKLVKASSSGPRRDEWWAQTCYPIGKERLLEAAQDGHLQSL